MPSGSKKRKAARKKNSQGNNQLSIEEDSSSKLESIDENTTMPAVDDGLSSNKENSSLSVVEETDELDGNDHGEVLNSSKENPVVIEAGIGLSCVDDSVALVQENVQALSQNMQAHQISEQLEGLKKMVFEGICEADKTRTTLHELLDSLTKIQQSIVEQ